MIGEETMLYRPGRDETEAVIGNLAKHYPQTFFLVPQQRRPLKKTIVDDLIEDGFPVAREPLMAAVDWYKSHFGYRYAMQAGAERIDLYGKSVGKVTEREAMKSKEYIADRKREAELRNNGERNGESDQDELMKPVRRMLRAPEEPKADPVARLQSKLDVVRRAMETPDQDLRRAFGIAGLEVLTSEIAKFIEELRA
jgi:sRNA-binding protein